MGIRSARYFKDAEFARCSPSCSIDDMEQSFLDKLDALRERCGMPLLLTSAYRSVEWELSKGRRTDGDHPRRRGVDIAANTNATRFKIVKAALELGFTRIGVANTFVHVGDVPANPQNVLWLY